MGKSEDKRQLTRAGDMQLVRDLLPLPPGQNRLLEAALDITADPAGAEDAVYSHAVLCQVGMPRKRTDSLTFERTNGTASMLLTAGKLYFGPKKGWIQQGLPYGPKPRLILLSLTSSAVKTGSRFVDVGRSTREFMTRMGLDPQGSEYRALRKQTANLSACRMQLGVTVGDRTINLDTQPVRKFDVWLTKNLEQESLWPGTVELSEEYFQSVRELAVPLHERAIAALRGSALSLDIYSWLAHRLCRIRQPKVSVSWQALKGQFGHEYADMRDFKQEFRATLLKVHMLYPDARVEDIPEGLILKPSPPPIPKVSIQGR